jgi:hypothetical protein
MSEWWTYTLSDFLLFSPRTYYRLFELYNLAVWPLHLLTLALGVAILVLWLRGTAHHGRILAAILAACWAWVAWAYLLERYDTINWAASYFAIGFAVQVVLLVWVGVIRGGLSLRPPGDRIGLISLAVFVFALGVQPLIGPFLGRPWTQVEFFGIAPDPTTIATLGVLLGTQRPHWLLLLIPLAWCVIGGATLWAMQAPDAPVLPVAVLLTMLVSAMKARSCAM